VQYTRGAARHKLFLITSGNRVEGSHIGRRLQATSPARSRAIGCGCAASCRPRARS
jgi:hypothetical protein